MIAQRPGLVRLSVNLNQETAAALKELSKRRGLTATEVVRRSISLQKFLQGERRRGRKVHTLNTDGTNVRELVFHA
jgi:hypothetical protein